MTAYRLEEIVAAHPFPGFEAWWPLGPHLLEFMSEAILAEWRALPGNAGDLRQVREHLLDYIRVVYKREARNNLIEDFVGRSAQVAFQSGEFDALSYAFFRAAFELIEQYGDSYPQSTDRERRLFTRRVGKIFFTRVADHLKLALPHQLSSAADFQQLRANIRAVGLFLEQQGYLRDRFDFTFDVHTRYAGGRIDQDASNFLSDLERNGFAYALYEMSYPTILPSAVYLYHTLGEAQHHSSRTIEELFARLCLDAHETDDFVPSEHAPDKVIELWEIRPL